MISPEADGLTCVLCIFALASTAVASALRLGIAGISGEPIARVVLLEAHRCREMRAPLRMGAPCRWKRDCSLLALPRCEAEVYGADLSVLLLPLFALPPA